MQNLLNQSVAVLLTQNVFASKEYEDFTQRCQNSNLTIDCYSNCDELIAFLHSQPDMKIIHLVISDHLFNDVIPRIHSNPHLGRIYVHNFEWIAERTWIFKYEKITKYSGS